MTPAPLPASPQPWAWISSTPGQRLHRCLPAPGPSHMPNLLPRTLSSHSLHSCLLDPCQAWLQCCLLREGPLSPWDCLYSLHNRCTVHVSLDVLVFTVVIAPEGKDSIFCFLLSHLPGVSHTKSGTTGRQLHKYCIFLLPSSNFPRPHLQALEAISRTRRGGWGPQRGQSPGRGALVVGGGPHGGYDVGYSGASPGGSPSAPATTGCSEAALFSSGHQRARAGSPTSLLVKQ